MNLHSTSQIKRTAKDVINKAKNLQRLGEKHITVVNGFRLHVEEHNHFYFRKDKISWHVGVPSPFCVFRSTAERRDKQEGLWEVQKGTLVSGSVHRQRRALRAVWLWGHFHCRESLIKDGGFVKTNSHTFSWGVTLVFVSVLSCWWQ